MLNLRFINIIRIIISSAIVPMLLLGCQTVSGNIINPQGTQMVEYPKVSDNANIVMNLQSNVSNTAFFIDERKIVTGRYVKILMDNKPHMIVAVPEGYNKKEEFVQPPYTQNSVLSFIFMLGDRIDKSENSIIIDVQIKGIDDGVKTNKQLDYKEAVLFAKREAIERAGAKIKSKSAVRNFILEEDYIESQSEAVLVPGYQIIDVGYGEDGFYHVVLIGKIRVRPEK